MVENAECKKQSSEFHRFKPVKLLTGRFEFAGVVHTAKTAAQHMRDINDAVGASDTYVSVEYFNIYIGGLALNLMQQTPSQQHETLLANADHPTLFWAFVAARAFAQNKTIITTNPQKIENRWVDPSTHYNLGLLAAGVGFAGAAATSGMITRRAFFVGAVASLVPADWSYRATQQDFEWRIRSLMRPTSEQCHTIDYSYEKTINRDWSNYQWRDVSTAHGLLHFAKQSGDIGHVVGIYGAAHHKMVHFLSEPAETQALIAKHIIYNRLGDPYIRAWSYDPIQHGFILKKNIRYI